MQDTHTREIKEQLYDRDPTALKCTAIRKVKIAVAPFQEDAAVSSSWSPKHLYQLASYAHFCLSYW